MKDSITLTIQEANELLAILVNLPYSQKPIIESVLKFIENKFADEEQVPPQEEVTADASPNS